MTMVAGFHRACPSTSSG